MVPLVFKKQGIIFFLKNIYTSCKIRGIRKNLKKVIYSKYSASNKYLMNY